MFKIAKLENVNNEIVSIDVVVQEQNEYKNGKKVLHESFKTLTFDISGDDYSFSFDLNCKLEELLKISMYETMDFNKYIFHSDTWLNVKEQKSIQPQIDVKITRYLKNKFIISINFYTDYSYYDDDSYSGMIEITFNLDEYLSSKSCT